MTITKAIIPVAGWGTRRLPITKSIEKCMLPIGNRPLVDYVIEDCILAGIKDVYFIVSEESVQLRSYYSRNETLERYLVKNGKEERIKQITPPVDIRFHFIVQPEGKYGTAVPVSLAFAEIEEDESVVVLMGDDFIFNKDGSSDVKRLIEATPEGDCAMLGVNIARDQVGQYGVLELNDNDEFVRIVEKPTPEDAPSTLINVSKYVLNHRAMKVIAEYVESSVEGEYYITDPINEYVGGGGKVHVARAKGQYLDGGTVEGWVRANNVVVGVS